MPLPEARIASIVDSIMGAVIILGGLSCLWHFAKLLAHNRTVFAQQIGDLFRALSNLHCRRFLGKNNRKTACASWGEHPTCRLKQWLDVQL
jgi:hypothetical protein